MNSRTEMPDIDPEIPEHAVSVYGQSDGAYDDFPVLKAFQQYIDSEQAKARKRMILLCAFFGGLMFVVISVFVVLLISASSRNQLLNDRLVEYAMKDRYQRTEQQAAAVDRQQPSSQETAAILALTTKLEDMQKKLAESQAAAERAEKAAAEAAKPKAPTPEELEITRLKVLLSAEREKQAVEREKQRQAELEEYRRKHYPELYEKKETVKESVVPAKQKVATPKKSANDELLEEVDQILNESKSVRYFDEEDVEDDAAVPVKKAKSPSQSKPQPAPQKEFSIPVDVRGSSSRWSVPNE